jgi:hypothetical protein
MNIGLLERLLGGDRAWSGPCTVVLDADAMLVSSGPDTILGGGVKSYAPRTATGRIEADACCLLKAEGAVLVVRQTVHKDGTGAEKVKQTTLVADAAHVAGLEFAGTEAATALGLPAPPAPKRTEYRPGMLVG